MDEIMEDHLMEDLEELHEIIKDHVDKIDGAITLAVKHAWDEEAHHKACASIKC